MLNDCLAPAALQKNDQVAIMCMAGKTKAHTIAAAVEILEKWGLKVHISQTIGAEEGSLGGTDALRRSELQKYLDDPAIKAIFSARGGYGSTRILDDIDFSTFKVKPKWLVGFSDITAVLAHVNGLGYQAIHGPMPKLFAAKGATKAVKLLKDALWGGNLQYDLKNNEHNILGRAEAPLCGGNLCILAHCVGSASELDTEGKILFIEDVGEYYYNIDRMLVQLKRAKKLQKLAGLLVGQFTDMTEGDNPFGKSLEQIILQHCGSYGYPIAFGFPAGHEADNRPLIMGGLATFSVTKDAVTLTQNTQ